MEQSSLKVLANKVLERNASRSKCGTRVEQKVEPNTRNVPLSETHYKPLPAFVSMTVFDVVVDGTVITVIAPGNVSMTSLEKNALARFGAERLQGVKLRNRVYRSPNIEVST